MIRNVKMKQLTQQQKKFITEYIKTLDTELSAKRAGYKIKNLKEFADKLLNKDFVIKEIKQQLQQQISSLCIHKGYVIQKLLQIAEFSLEKENILDKDGIPTGKEKLRDASAGLKALESLCKYLDFNNEPSYQEAKIITISNLDDDKI